MSCRVCEHAARQRHRWSSEMRKQEGISHGVLSLHPFVRRPSPDAKAALQADATKCDERRESKRRHDTSRTYRREQATQSTRW
ncbi:MAG TPA: hypothetical protein VNG51_22355, partial [Ktedonobacteraceae bacterium]|nr:hypothetical protein [Ktedonobacteraceae bacterium]